jgi:putative ABC transport system substrate-binding protein
MKKKLIFSSFAVLIFAVSFSVEAQPQAKVPTVVRLSPISLASDGQREMLVQALRALVYVEGKNLAFEYRYAENKLDRLSSLAEELVGLKVDVLVVPSTPGALAAKNATGTTPVAVGQIDGPARLGGNVTGFTTISPAVLAGKRLELLKETVAKLSRVAVLWNPKDPASAQQWQESQLAARELGLQLYSMEVSSADKLDGAFKAAIKARSAALAVTDHALVVSNQKLIANLAIKYRLPAIYGRPDHIDSGGLMSYGADEAEVYRRLASMVDKILKGAKPADIPVEQPMKFEFIINLKAAKQIGLTIPPNVLVRAQKVIR